MSKKRNKKHILHHLRFHFIALSINRTTPYPYPLKVYRISLIKPDRELIVHAHVLRAQYQSLSNGNVYRHSEGICVPIEKNAKEQ